MIQNSLYNNKPRRLFTFGCSFTSYAWATWANILGFELNKTIGTEFYNFGKSGAGNTYIANVISQADQYYKFDSNDLVIVCWTSFCREDRWINDKWECHGNIYSPHSIYDKHIVNKIADNFYFLMRDLAHIKLVHSLLNNKTQYHFITIKDIISENLIHNKQNYYKLKKNYNDIINKIHSSYYKVLWKNDVKVKYQQDQKLLHKHYKEGHPLPIEHFLYLTKIFDYKFSEDTKSIVKKVTNDYKNLIADLYSDIIKDCHPAEFSKDKRDKFYAHCENLLIYKSKELSNLIII